MTQGSPPGDELIAWMSGPPKSPSPVIISPETLRQKHAEPQVWQELLLKEIQDALREGKVVVASLSIDFQQGQKHSICGIGQSLDSFIQGLSIESPIELRLSSLVAEKIYITTGGMEKSDKPRQAPSSS
jgi:hypothetical protein